jgi:hypothetical protein
MKRYVPDDFKTFFARQQAVQELETIDWDLLEEYEDSGLLGKLQEIVHATRRSDALAEFAIHSKLSELVLLDGRKVPIATAMQYATAHGQKTYLRAMKIFEDAFSESTDLHDIFTKHFNQEMPRAGEINFPIAFKVYPAEATQIYFQFRFPREMTNGQVYFAVAGYLNHVLANNGIGPGPTNIDGLTALSLITQGWEAMASQIQDEILPPPDSLGRRGPPIH